MIASLIAPQPGFLTH